MTQNLTKNYANLFEFRKKLFLSIDVKTEEAFKTLVPDKNQRLYLIEKALGLVISSKTMQYPLDIELPSSEEAFIIASRMVNEPPVRVKISDLQRR